MSKSTRDDLDAAHKLLCRASGRIVIMIVKGAVSPRRLAEALDAAERAIPLLRSVVQSLGETVPPPSVSGSDGDVI